MSKALRAVSLLAVLALLILGLMACSGGEDVSGDSSANGEEPADSEGEEEVAVYEENGLPKDEEVTLKYGYFEAGDGREWFDYAKDTFTEKFPNVKFDVTYSPDIAKITGTKIQANDDEDMFDIFDGSVPGGIPALVEAGKLEPVDDLWEHELYDTPGKTVKEMAQEGTFESATRYDGKVYNLPIRGSVGGLFYNQNLFEKEGWETTPKTWDEFVALLEEIKADGYIPITFPGLHPGYINNAFGNWSLFELAEHNGRVEEFREEYQTYTPPHYTSPEMLEMWGKIYELGQKGFFPEGVAALDHVQSQMQVVQDQAALVSTASWVENEMKDSAPDDFKWGFMGVPMTNDPDQTIWVRDSPGGGSYIWAGKPDLNKKWAKEFVVWMWNMDVQQAIAEKGGIFPLRKDYGDDPDRLEGMLDVHQSIVEYRGKNKIRGESGAKTVSLADPAASQASKTIQEATTKIVSGEQDPKPILEKAEELLIKALEAEGLLED